MRFFCVTRRAVVLVTVSVEIESTQRAYVPDARFVRRELADELDDVIGRIAERKPQHERRRKDGCNFFEKHGCFQRKEGVKFTLYVFSVRCVSPVFRQVVRVRYNLGHDGVRLEHRVLHR